jgi:hypothetical protein
MNYKTNTCPSWDKALLYYYLIMLYSLFLVARFGDEPGQSSHPKCLCRDADSISIRRYHSKEMQVITAPLSSMFDREIGVKRVQETKSELSNNLSMKTCGLGPVPLPTKAFKRLERMKSLEAGFVENE